MLSIGSDILSVSRIARVWQRFPAALVKKILSSEEARLFHELSDEATKLRFLAGRFCGKEAVFKAAQEPLTWKRVSLLPVGLDPKPMVFVNQELRRDLSVSISHEQDFAISVAIKHRL